MFDRQSLALAAPHQCSFIAFDGQQIAKGFDFALLAFGMRQRGNVIRFGVLSLHPSA